MAYHYYIYYRVMPGQIAHVAEQAARLLHRVAALTGIAGKIRRRSDETATFLEIYEGVSDRARFERWLDEAERACDAASWPAAGDARHRECFED